MLNKWSILCQNIFQVNAEITAYPLYREKSMIANGSIVIEALRAQEHFDETISKVLFYTCMFTQTRRRVPPCGRTCVAKIKRESAAPLGGVTEDKFPIVGRWPNPRRKLRFVSKSVDLNKAKLAHIFVRNVLVYGPMMFCREHINTARSCREEKCYSPEYELYLRMVRNFDIELCVTSNV